MRKFMKTAMAGTLSLAMVLGVTGVAAPEASAAKVKVKKVAVTSPSGKVVYVAKGKKVKLSTTVKVSPQIRVPTKKYLTNLQTARLLR